MEKCPLPISGSQNGYIRVLEGKFRTDPYCRSYLCLIKENGLAKFGVKRNDSPSRRPPLLPAAGCLASVLVCSFLEFVSRRETYFSFFPVSEDSPLVLLKLQLLNTCQCHFPAQKTCNFEITSRSCFLLLMLLLITYRNKGLHLFAALYPFSDAGFVCPESLRIYHW